MNRIAMLGVLNGLLSAGFGVAALLFFKSFSTTRDRLFALFGTAFALMAVERLLIPVDVMGADNRVWLYGLRLIAFIVIIYAIVDKNRAHA